MITWNYRVVHREIDGEHVYAIHEVYYTAGVPDMVTENPIYPMGETWDEFRADLNSYNMAMIDPVLEYDDISPPRESKINKYCIRCGTEPIVTKGDVYGYNFDTGKPSFWYTYVCPKWNEKDDPHGAKHMNWSTLDEDPPLDPNNIG